MSAEKEITVRIRIDGLPEQSNYNALKAKLEEEIDNAVGQAVCNSFEDGIEAKNWSVIVTPFWR